MPRTTLTAVLAALAALDVVIRLDPFGWLGPFTTVPPLSALQSGFWVLMLAAALYAAPALTAGGALIVGGSSLIAAAELVRLATLIWESQTLANLVGADDLSTLLHIQEAAAVVAGTCLALGVCLLSWSLWRESGWSPHRSTAVRWLLILLAVLAGAFEAISLATEAVRVPISSADVLVAWVYYALDILIALAWVPAAVLTLRSARSGPPLDWRWPVGIGVTLYLVATVLLRLAIFVTNGSGRIGPAEWFVWIRLASVCGIALVIAGLAGSAFIRYPEEAPPTSAG